MDTAALRAKFKQIFPDAAGETVAVRAPGRVNLIGEHTDYNEGFVCPMAIDRATLIVASPRTDAVVRFHSTLTGETAEFHVDREIPKAGLKWALYAKGAIEAMRRAGKLKRGFDAAVDTDVPLGGGLSSSASFEVASALAALTVNGETMDPVELALACQWAEHNYPGMPCGIMDQFISAMGKAGRAMLLDCRSKETRQVRLDDPGVKVVISNTNVKHELVAGEYTGRRHQCEAAVAFIKRRSPEITSLRDVSMEMLEDSRLGMDPTCFRRARHVVGEIARTVEFAGALEKRDYATCGELMYASHASLRDDYAVSCAELDALVEISRGVEGVIGARMTGGGFGGCIVALVKAEAVEKLTAAIEKDYPKMTGGRMATTFATVASEGAHVER